MKPSSIFPCLLWARDYRREYVSSDIIAAIIVTIMLIPQSLAYALLAGLPPETGLYASLLPLVAYGIFGVLEAINVRLGELGIGFHLSEIKGPVMDGLEKSDLLHHLNGSVFLTQHQAVNSLSSEGAAPLPLSLSRTA